MCPLSIVPNIPIDDAKVEACAKALAYDRCTTWGRQTFNDEVWLRAYSELEREKFRATAKLVLITAAEWEIRRKTKASIGSG